MFQEGVLTGGFWARHGYEWKLWPVWLFLVAAVLGVLVVPEVTAMVDGSEFPARLRALGIFKGWVVAPILYFSMARFYFREKPSLIAWSLRACLAGGVVLSLMALWQVVTGEFVTMDGRASGPFESANYLALYLGPLAVFSVLAAVRKGELRSAGELGLVGDRVFLGVSAALCLLALFFTQSYAAWISVGAGIFVGLLLSLWKSSRRVFWISVGVLAVVLVGGVLLQLGSEKFQQFLEFSERSSSSVRLEVYQIALDLIRQHPFLGIGLGQFEQQYQVNAAAVLGHAPFEWVMLHPHNIFLAFWLNMGLLGLVAFVWLCVKAFAWLREDDKKERRIAACMLVAIVVHGLFDTPYFKNDLSFQFWMLLAMLL